MYAMKGQFGMGALKTSLSQKVTGEAKINQYIPKESIESEI
jgi:hypothetical protein